MALVFSNILIGFIMFLIFIIIFWQFYKVIHEEKEGVV